MSGATLGDTVEFDFGAVPLEQSASCCAADELWPIVQELVKPGASILEAGAGSGRWIKFLSDHGYRMAGVEYNVRDVERFRQTFPELAFDAGDIRKLPYPDESFDAVMSLGVFEHLIDGPESAANEMLRVLKRGGVAIFTVPHANFLFGIERLVDPIRYWLLGSNLLRRVLGRKLVSYSKAAERSRLSEVTARTLSGLPVKYLYNSSFGVSFYEYRYTRGQASKMLTDAGFRADEIRLMNNKDRIYQVFGDLVGSYNGVSHVRLNRIGQLIKAVLPRSWTSHMVLVVARKP